MCGGGGGWVLWEGLTTLMPHAAYVGAWTVFILMRSGWKVAEETGCGKTVASAEGMLAFGT